jgi:hypothetical protein
MVQYESAYGPVEVRRDGDGWSVYIDGHHYAGPEAFTRADTLAMRIAQPRDGWPDEIDEVADADNIRAWLRRVEKEVRS